MTFAQINAAVTAANTVNPVTVSPCLMVFQIDATLTEGSTKMTVITRVVYPGAPVVFNRNGHFTPSASRDVLNKLGHRYGFITFSARGNAERKLMQEKVEKYRNHGIRFQGEKFEPVIAQVDGDDVTMLLVSTSKKIDTRSGLRNIRSLADMGINVSSDPKAGKRVRRLLANYLILLEGVEITQQTVDSGTEYTVLLEDNRTIRVLNFNMSLLTSQEEKFIDGSVVINLPEFNGCTATVQGSFGQGKGIGYAVPGTEAYDVIIYGAKKEVTSDRFFIGALNMIHKGELRTDWQSILNMGSYDEHLLVDMTMRLLNRRAEMLMDGDEMQVLELFAPQARAADAAYNKARGLEPKWGAMQALEYGIGSRFVPVLFRRLFRHGFENLIDLKKGKISIPMEGGARVYVRWNPNLIDLDRPGFPDLSLDTWGTWEGLPVVSIAAAPEGEVLLGRNPNAHPGEFKLVWNSHILKGDPWCYLGSNAGEIMGYLNDGDMDDSVMAIWNAAFVAKWKTMSYPVQPKLEVPKPLPMNDARAARVARMTGIKDQWSWNIFDQNMEEYTGFSQSLGAFIIKGSIEMLLSGEHRQTILEGIDNDTFLVPDNFIPPSEEDLKAMLSKDMKHLAEDYIPTEEGFLAMARTFVATKADYRGARAMSNSFVIIDWEVMKKGDKAQVLDLFAEAAELIKTPVFPMCFKDRVPAKRKLAGDYILVETKLCKALAAIKKRYEEIQQEAMEMEQLIVRTLPSRLLEMYPADENVLANVDDLRSIWIQALAAQKDEETGDLMEGGFEKAALGYRQEEGDRVVRQAGLIDFYAYQFEENAEGDLVTTNRPWSPEMRRKMVIHWLNDQYAAKKTTDGVPDFMLTDFLAALKEAGLTGRTVFANLNSEGRKYDDRLASGEFMEVVAYAGILYHARNNRQLTDEPSPYLFDGGYAMYKGGVIPVRFADAEVQSSWKEVAKIARAENHSDHEGMVID